MPIATVKNHNTKRDSFVCSWLIEKGFYKDINPDQFGSQAIDAIIQLNFNFFNLVGIKHAISIVKLGRQYEGRDLFNDYEHNMLSFIIFLDSNKQSVDSILNLVIECDLSIVLTYLINPLCCKVDVDISHLYKSITLENIKCSKVLIQHFNKSMPEKINVCELNDVKCQFLNQIIKELDLDFVYEKMRYHHVKKLL